MHNSRKNLIPFLIFSIIIIVSLACGGTSTVSPTIPSTIQGEQASTSVNQTQPSNPPKSTNTPAPTNTPIPPTPTTNSNIIQPGTYLVGVDIQSGIYKGQAGADLMNSCYWERLKDLSGSLESVLANENAVGQLYIEVLNSDYALKTACELVFLSPLPTPPDVFPTKIGPGTYLVGVDIQPGTYKGQAGADIMNSCYWGRLKDLSGSLESVLANENAVGQFYIQVSQNDFALKTACKLEFAGN